MSTVREERQPLARAVRGIEVPPTPVRLAASQTLTGKGVTIAFLDSGFTPHPDLAGSGRIVEYIDVTGDGAPLECPAPESWRWHGTQTSVAAAGDGRLSNGVYRGLAPEARVVLVKVSRAGRIGEEEIALGFEWLLAHHERLGIRVVNVSLGGDVDAPLSESRVNRLAEEAVRRGLVVVVAAGNSGCSARPTPVPPATAPSVVTVGGYDDAKDEVWCGSWGASADGIVKPEVLAPSLRIAAPLVHGTELHREADALARLADAPENELRRLTWQLLEDARLPQTSGFARLPEIRSEVLARLRERRVIARHYQHSEGTSFAAPIVSSLVAQILEARPELTPAAVKQVLIASADRVQGAAAMRQGFGVVNAGRAVALARKDRHVSAPCAGCAPRIERRRLVFTFHDDAARSVRLHADFRGQMAVAGDLAKNTAGLWEIGLEAPLPGRYRYKFVVDDARWLEDPTHGLKEDDGYGGFNSILHVGWDVR